MIKEALEYIIGLKAPVVQEINGNVYSDKPLSRISYNPAVEKITMSTLSSLVKYIKEFRYEMAPRMIIHVHTPLSVSLYSQLDDDRKREVFAVVIGNVPDFRFDSFMNHEEFCIGLQSKFMPCEDLSLLLKFAGTVESGSVAQYGDDGVTQKATIKTGLASKSDALVPSPVVLRPYRTFIEVEQPQSSFIFRMKQGVHDEVSCALFEADGGAWTIEAMRNVAEYLRAHLDSEEGITVIS